MYKRAPSIIYYHEAKNRENTLVYDELCVVHACYNTIIRSTALDGQVKIEQMNIQETVEAHCKSLFKKQLVKDKVLKPHKPWSL